MNQNDVIRGLLDGRSGLLAYAWSILGDEHVAEDVFQEVMVLAVEKHQKIAGPEVLISWARTTLRYRALHAIRDRKLSHQGLDESILDQLDQRWESQAETGPAGAISQKSEALQRCVDQLTPYAKEIVSLRYKSGLSGKKVAAQLQRKDRTIYMALSRIHNTLRECIQTRIAGGCE